MVKTLHTIRDWFRHEHEPPPASSAYLIVGLGNPGERYVRNRHNVGFQCVDHLARTYGVDMHRKRFKAALGEGQIGSQRVVLAKPLTFMNESGQAVAPISHWFKIPPERILVIYDDLDLPMGKVRLRPNGSSGGHKGLASIIAELGTRNFNRLRIGIGRPEQGDPVDYVLSNFAKAQEPVIQEVCDQSAQIVLRFIEEGIQKAMNAYNSGA